MGLESFETDSQRTFTRKKKKHEEGFVIHLSKELNEEEVRIPERVTIHRMHKFDEGSVIKVEDSDHVFICGDCGRVSTSLVGALKTDKLRLGDSLWMEMLMEMTEEIEDQLETTELWSGDHGVSADNVEEDEEDETIEPTTGIDSFKT